jgi:molecular chaperone DnaK
VTNPENTIFSIKRFMGRKYGEVGQEIGRVPYHRARETVELGCSARFPR